MLDFGTLKHVEVHYGFAVHPQP
jgi:hypothetical protein